MTKKKKKKGKKRRDRDLDVKFKRIYIEREEELFIAHFPLFGLASQGYTEKEAEQNLIEAVGIYVVTFLEGNSVDVFIEEMRK